ncbi:dynamin family protein [Kutzneria albida]|uniref:Dynamin N-terminal domain-containing protein n=1 Tax=Kutzneria albida DSM 43870 TaxID=1449976 RepID=W5W6W5_9PSEU|nr:dynamin family protein [Kutzneria albida]AHH96261.1 hypothetical protein KALB_2893 [Kutzneria albida DSM 43870]
MSDEALRRRTAEAFERALRQLGGSPALEDARLSVRDAARQVTQPMRLALVGRISSGKSTLANALLGNEVVATGARELTYNVSWLRQVERGGRERLVVHLRGGGSQEWPLAELAVLSGNNEVLTSIDYLEVLLDNAELAAYDLVDTPGLDSHLGADQENTLRTLRLTASDVRRATISHAARAHAVVLVFCRGLAAGDEELMAEFQGAAFGAATPVTAVGALTKVELLWPQYPDPLGEGYRIAERMMTVSGARRMVYDLRPVASKVAEGAATLTEQEFADLLALAAGDPALLDRRLARGPFFASRPYEDLPVPARRRAQLLRRLDRYGVHLACGLIRAEGVDRLPQLRKLLLDRSGMTEFRRLLTGHFGNRADLIKLRQAVDQALALPARLDLGPVQRFTVEQAVAHLRQAELDEHGFAELRVLRQHYNGELRFDPADSAELARVTGEHGTSTAARLGLPEGSPPQLVRTRAADRIAHWSARAVDPAYSRATRQAAQVLVRSYERLITG